MSTFIRRLTIVVSCIVMGVVTSASATVVFDDFEDGIIDSSLWTVTAWDSASSVAETGGHAVFTDRGRLVSKASFGTVVAQGVFTISGPRDDSFGIKTRVSVPDGGPGIGFIIGSSDNPEWDSFGGNVYIVTHDESMNRLELGRAWAVVPVGTPVPFRVEDDGDEVRFYVNDMSTPLLTGQSNVGGGDHVSFQNREDTGSFIPPHISELDWVQITPEPGTFILLVAGMGIVSVFRRR